jgi:hypothetical protein
MYVYELVDFLDNFGESVAYLENDEHNGDGENT